MTAEQGTNGRRIAQELFGLFLIFWGLLVLLSLVSYDQGDPGINHAVSASAHVKNSAGLFGAYLSGLLVDIFGVAALVWPAIFAAWGAGCISTWFSMPWWRWCGFILLTLCLISVGAAWNIGIGDVRGGGMLGMSLYQKATAMFNPVGSLLIWLFLFFLSLELAFGIAWLTLIATGARVLKRRLDACPAFRRALRPAWLPGGKQPHDAETAPPQPDAPDRAEPNLAGSEDADPNTADRNTANLDDADDIIPLYEIHADDPLPGEESHVNGKAAPSLVEKESAEPFIPLSMTPPETGRDTSHSGASASSVPSLARTLVQTVSDIVAETASRLAPERVQSTPGPASAAEHAAPLIPHTTERRTAPASPDAGPFSEPGLTRVPDASPLSPVPANVTPRDMVTPAPVSAVAPMASGTQVPSGTRVPTDVKEHRVEPAPLPATGHPLDTPVEQAAPVSPASAGSGWPSPPPLTQPSQAQPSQAQIPPAPDTRPHSQAPAATPAPATAPATALPGKRPPVMPSLDLLRPPQQSDALPDPAVLDQKSRELMNCLADFNVQGELIRVTPGPVITLFEIRPAPGVRVGRITNLNDDLARSLRAEAVRIQAPVPGSDTVGIELPNAVRATVNFRELVQSPAFQESNSRLTMALGKDIEGRPAVRDLATMPHALVAGTTGSGKSVCLNSILVSLLYKATPDEVKLMLIDPKRVEMAMYRDMPHLVHPVVTEMSLAKTALDWAVHEMERRYDCLARLGVKNIKDFNKKILSMGENRPPALADLVFLPYLVIVIDELADLMMTAGKEVEACLVRLAQLARAAGIHLIVATQRPSVDVVTGILRANFPCRIAFQVANKYDSRTILDASGAEKLLGKGDMLFKPSGGKLQRLHGPFVTDEEVEAVVEHWKRQLPPRYEVDFSEWGMAAAEAKATGGSSSGGAGGVSSEEDALYAEAVAFVQEQGRMSISLLQRRFRIGFNKAARFVERMEQEGILPPASRANKARQVRADS